MEPLALDARTTALVLVDLQRGIVGRQTGPRAPADVVAQARRLAARFREAAGTVVLVRVAYSPDGRDRLTQRIDAPPLGGAVGPDFSELVPELGQAPGDVVVT